MVKGGDRTGSIYSSRRLQPFPFASVLVGYVVIVQSIYKVFLYTAGEWRWAD